ncbi:hypothetical protein QYF61_027738, partial [Mycteria americana]
MDLGWQHKGELFIAQWAHDTSGHQGRVATYRWARDRGVDLTMDTIAQVIHECETCTAIKKAKWLKPLDCRGLNEVTPPLSAAVPDTLELQYELESKAAKWYATTDIANAFFSIPLAAECRPQFAFTWSVQYTWNRLPQGWKHSPTICHGLIQTAHYNEECSLLEQQTHRFSGLLSLPAIILQGRWLKYKYGEAWQIDYITLPEPHQGKCYVLTMVEATTGWLQTYPVPHATTQNTILGLEKQVL